MKYLTFVFILLLSPIFVFPQEDSTNYQNEEVELIMFYDRMPEFPGGDQARMKYLNSNITYTEKAIKDKVGGTVYVTFMVGKDGKIRDARILRGIHPDLDSISLSLINNMPHWTPATQRGESVECQFNMPIRFGVNERSTSGAQFPSKYWRKKGKRKFYKACDEEFKLSQEECDCWYQYVIHKYNGLKLESIDLEVLFQKEECK